MGCKKLDGPFSVPRAVKFEKLVVRQSVAGGISSNLGAIDVVKALIFVGDLELGKIRVWV